MVVLSNSCKNDRRRKNRYVSLFVLTRIKVYFTAVTRSVRKGKTSRREDVDSHFIYWPTTCLTKRISSDYHESLFLSLCLSLSRTSALTRVYFFTTSVKVRCISNSPPFHSSLYAESFSSAVLKSFCPRMCFDWWCHRKSCHKSWPIQSHNENLKWNFNASEHWLWVTS